MRTDLAQCRLPVRKAFGCARILLSALWAFIALSGCAHHPSANIGRPTPPGEFALGFNKGVDHALIASMDPSVRHFESETVRPIWLGTAEVLYRGAALLPQTPVVRWGTLPGWDLGLSLGSTYGVDSRLALWGAEDQRMLVVTGDLYLGFRQEAHSRLLWFEPLASSVSLLLGGGVSNGRYPQYRVDGVRRLAERREGRADVLVGSEIVVGQTRFVVAVNAYQVIGAGEREDLRQPYSEVDLPELDVRAIWLSIGVETLLTKRSQ